MSCEHALQIRRCERRRHIVDERTCNVEAAAAGTQAKEIAGA